MNNSLIILPCKNIVGTTSRQESSILYFHFDHRHLLLVRYLHKYFPCSSIDIPSQKSQIINKCLHVGECSIGVNIKNPNLTSTVTSPIVYVQLFTIRSSGNTVWPYISIPSRHCCYPNQCAAARSQVIYMTAFTSCSLFGVCWLPIVVCGDQMHPNNLSGT